MRRPETTTNGHAKAAATDEIVPRLVHAPAEPHVIHDDAVYFVEDFQRLFRLRKSTLRREVRGGRLRVAKRGGRYLVLGAWVKAWIQAGEVRRRQAHVADEQP
jgi:hypothetical protein